jgi:hypothetical protein
MVQRITDDVSEHYPFTVILYGSAARYLIGQTEEAPPNDIDLMVVCNNSLAAVESRDYGFPLELHRFHTDEIIAIAKSLRYDSIPIGLSKLYGKQTLRGHARDVIAACLLLGPGYRDFGIEQIEVDGLTDPRDYSTHEVFHGRRWWGRLQKYARERRGPLKRWSDRIVMNDRFTP